MFDGGRVSIPKAFNESQGFAKIKRAFSPVCALSIRINFVNQFDPIFAEQGAKGFVNFKGLTRTKQLGDFLEPGFYH